MPKQIFVIDGAQFSSLYEFAFYFSKTVLKDHVWHGGLDAFNDILRGGFGTPEGGFILRWENSALSRRCLGYAETLQWLSAHFNSCSPDNMPTWKYLKERMGEAQKGCGETLFDMIVEIIQVHGSGGVEATDGVELYLV